MQGARVIERGWEACREWLKVDNGALKNIYVIGVDVSRAHQVWGTVGQLAAVRAEGGGELKLDVLVHAVNRTERADEPLVPLAVEANGAEALLTVTRLYSPGQFEVGVSIEHRALFDQGDSIARARWSSLLELALAIYEVGAASIVVATESEPETWPNAEHWPVDPLVVVAKRD